MQKGGNRMPTTQQLLDEINALYPSSLSQDQKIIWMNQALRILYKYMNDNNIYEFLTVANQPFYTLPSDCPIDQIILVEVASDLAVTTSTTMTPYDYAAFNEGLDDGNYYYDAMKGLIGLWPIPSAAGYSAKILYRPKPFMLDSTSTGLAKVPAVNEDYQPAIVYYTLTKVCSAGHNPDVQLVNNYTNMYNAVIEMLFKDLMTKKSRRPTKTKHNRWWNGGYSGAKPIQF